MEYFLCLAGVNSSTLVFSPLFSLRLVGGLAKGLFFPLKAIITETIVRIKTMEITKTMETIETTKIIEITKTTETTESIERTNTQIIRRQEERQEGNNRPRRLRKLRKSWI